MHHIASTLQPPRGIAISQSQARKGESSRSANSPGRKLAIPAPTQFQDLRETRLFWHLVFASDAEGLQNLKTGFCGASSGRGVLAANESGDRCWIDFRRTRKLQFSVKLLVLHQSPNVLAARRSEACWRIRQFRLREGLRLDAA